MKYGIGIFKNGGISIKQYTNASTIKSFALIFLKSKVKEEGLSFNPNGLKTFLNGWVEHFNESGNDIESHFQIVDTVSDTLTYSNVHLQKLVGDTWLPLTSEDKKEFCNVIVNKLESVPEKV